MKQKEKWAKEYCGNPDNDSRLTAQYEAWLAGFEFAMEKVEDYLYEHSIEGTLHLTYIGKKEI